MAEQNTDPRHLILFDGYCGFCGRAVSFIPPRDRRGVFRYASLESHEGEAIRGSHSLGASRSGTLLVVPSGKPKTEAPLERSAAVLFIVRHLDWPWKLLGVLRWLPKRLLDWGYERVARHRYMLSGASDSCALAEKGSEQKAAR